MSDGFSVLFFGTLIRLLLSGAAVICLVPGAWAAPLVELNRESIRVDLPPYVDVLEDAQRNLSIDDVRGDKYANRFSPSPLTELFFGYTHSVYWLRFSVENQLDYNKALILEVSPADIDYIELFGFDSRNNQLLTYKLSGSAVAFEHRDYNHPLYYFDLAVAPGETNHYFVRLESNKTINAQLKLSTPREHFFYSSMRDWWQGFFFGALLLLAIAHIGLSVVFKYKGFAYCGLWLFSVTLIQGSWHGYYIHFLQPSTELLDRQLMTSIYLSVIFGVLFTRSYLDTHRRMPAAHRVLTFFLVLALMGMPCAWLFTPSRNALLVGAVAMPVSLLMFVLGVYSFLEGYKPARYFLLARTVTLLMILIAVFADQGLLPDVLTITYGLVASFTFEGLVFMVAMISQRTKVSRHQPVAAENVLPTGISPLMPVSACCHELRTPVSGVMGMSELLLETPLSNQQRVQVESIHESGKALLDVINKISDLAAVESGEMELRDDAFEVMSLIERCVENARPLAEQRHIEMVYQVDEAVSGWVRGDGERLQQAISSLVHFSIRHQEAGEILLTAKQTDREQVLFEIISGRNVLAREAALTADTPVWPLTSADNLNVTLARHFIALMGGVLDIQHRPDHGLRLAFQVFLRKQKRDAGREEGDELLHGKCLLVVDDNETCCRIIQQQATRWGMEALCTSGGKEALALLRSRAALHKPVDLLLVDYEMPGMNGVDLLLCIEQERETLKLEHSHMLLLTGVSKMPQASADKHMKSVRILYKPLSGKSLKMALIGAFH
jgi:signal transduction histidine kinase/ActR/RegA family two-component response regulator